MTLKRRKRKSSFEGEKARSFYRNGLFYALAVRCVFALQIRFGAFFHFLHAPYCIGAHLYKIIVCIFRHTLHLKHVFDQRQHFKQV